MLYHSPLKIITKQVWQLPTGTPALRLKGGWMLGPLEQDGKWTVIRIDIVNVVLQLSDGSKLYCGEGIYLYLDPHELRKHGEIIEGKMTEVDQEAIE